LIDKFCIEKMYETILSHGSKSAVGGFIINKNKINKNSSKLLNLFKNFLINNTFYIRNWTITKSGLGYGFTGNVDNLLIEDVEWISGGCMIHYKENLIYENFIIFEGKAYYEDLVHSFLLRQNKIQLLLNYTAKCTHNNHENIYNLCIVDFFNYFANEYKSRKYFVKLAKLNYLNLNLWSLVILIKYFLNKIFNFVNK
ncbi:hypothetical protein OAK12_01650, partial [Alphaproteobacteria bacterium]|nr:hypothetical protein [Alphaproteobacteria bacterium]